jgi:hypothetical protein
MLTAHRAQNENLHLAEPKNNKKTSTQTINEHKKKYGKSEITSSTLYNHQTYVLIVTIHGLKMKAQHPGSFSGEPLREFLSTRCLDVFTFYVAFKYHVSKNIFYRLYYKEKHTCTINIFSLRFFGFRCRPFPTVTFARTKHSTAHIII